MWVTYLSYQNLLFCKTDLDLEYYSIRNHENVFTGFLLFTISQSKYAITMKVVLLTPNLCPYVFSGLSFIPCVFADPSVQALQ